MRAGQIYSPKPFSPKRKDSLTTKHRKTFLTKTAAVSAAVLVVLIAAMYALFFSSWLRIRQITVNGLDGEHTTAVTDAIQGRINHRFVGIPIGNNILFTRSSSVANALKAQFSFLQTVQVSKDYPHQIIVNATERQAAGVWCFNIDCHYFDHNGVIWGNAVQSSGFLFLNVNDMRANAGPQIDQRFLNAIQTVVAKFNDLGIKIKDVTIPTGSYSDFDVMIAAGYPVEFSLDSNIPDQLDVFRIFKEKQIDSGTVVPSQYLDLRYDGRVYWK